MRRFLIPGLTAGLIVAALCGTALASDLEVRKEVAAPGDVSATLPPATGVRSLSIRLGAPPGASVSSLIEWTPSDRELTVRLIPAAAPDRPLALLKGRSPIAIGARTETAGATLLLISDPAGGAESVAIKTMINWSAVSSPSQGQGQGADQIRPVRRESVQDVGRQTLSNDAFSSDSPVRLVEISWREDGEIALATLRRDGLALRFSGAVNPEMARKAISIEIGFPGRAPGLIAFEEVVPEVRALGDRLLVFLPRDLTLTAITPVRLVLDGDRLLGRNGQFTDLDGSGLTLPTGDGRPGGLFRSAFRIAP
jgi:hypothetical protein